MSIGEGDIGQALGLAKAGVPVPDAAVGVAERVTD